MKHCPKCRVESRHDAEWCWFCGYAYEDAEARPSQRVEDEDAREPAPDTDVPEPP